jgi:hypothetical protein
MSHHTVRGTLLPRITSHGCKARAAHDGKCDPPLITTAQPMASTLRCGRAGERSVCADSIALNESASTSIRQEVIVGTIGAAEDSAPAPSQDWALQSAAKTARRRR